MQSSMSPAQQFQTSQSFLGPGSVSLPHHLVSPYSYSSSPAQSQSKFSHHFSPVRPEPVPASGSWTPHSQISSPASLDSTGDTSSPTSPLSPGCRDQQWYHQPSPFYSTPSFGPPNTVAPPSSLQHRPLDNVFGGGAHRGAPPPRGGIEMVQDTRESYAARHYGGSANTVAPLNVVHSPANLSRAGSCQSYGSMMSPQESGFSVHISELLTQLGISETELILKSTRDLNKFLKSKGLSRDYIKTIKQQRRTMKNRGYAAACRKKQDDQFSVLNDEILKLEQDNSKTEEKIHDINREIEKVRHNIQKLEEHLLK